MEVDSCARPNIDWVEFLGASGVGKSTLYHETLRIRPSVDQWQTVDEALEGIAKNYLSKNRASLTFPSQLRIYLRRLSPFRRLRGYKLVRNKLRYIAENSLGRKYDFFCELLMQNLDPENELTPHKRLSFLSWFHTNRLLDFMVLEYFRVGNIIVHEDGILHNNPGITEKSINELTQRTPGESGFNSIPKGIVYCFADDSLVLERVKQRNLDGFGTMLQDGMTTDQLINFIKKDLSINQAKVDFLQKLGTPVIPIDTTKDLRENSRLVNEFISDLAPECPEGRRGLPVTS